MNFAHPLALLTIGFVVVVVGYWVVTHYFSEEAKQERRRRRSNTRVASTAKRPTVKFSVRRRRPAGEWGKIYRSTDPHSFPSGHAARAFMLAVLALGMGPLWFGLLLLLWSPLVSQARASMGVHYLSDIVAGMVFGLVLGGLVLSFVG